MLLPTTCAVCDAPGGSPCPSCQRALRPAPPDLARPPGVDACRSVVLYEGAGRELVARLKYRNRRASAPWLAAAMAEQVRGVEVDAVTWVPTTAARRRRRGFDQAQLLARGVARELRLPRRSLLRRRPGPAQTGRTVTERQIGPRLVARRAAPRRVLLVDDVCTTGATLATAAAVLRGAGAETVIAVTAARALRRH